MFYCLEISKTFNNDMMKLGMYLFIYLNEVYLYEQ